MPPQTPIEPNDTTNNTSQSKLAEVCAPLCRVTPVSKILAAVVMIILPFVGGYVGYQYAIFNNDTSDDLQTVIEQQNLPESNITTPDMSIAATSTSSIINPTPIGEGWVSLPASTGGKDIIIKYPAVVPIDSETIQNRKPFALGIDPYYPNFILPIKSGRNVFYAELTTDLKNLFYLQYDTDSQDSFSLYQATIADKIIKKITQYKGVADKVTYNYSEYLNSEYIKSVRKDVNRWLFMPVLYREFITYNTFSKGIFLGRVESMNNIQLTYTAPCGLEFKQNFDISEDKKHIVWTCVNLEMSSSKVYLYDWSRTEQLTFPKSIVGLVIFVQFIKNDRIQIVDASQGNDMLRAPIYSVNLAGGDLRKEAGDVYLGY